MAFVGCGNILGYHLDALQKADRCHDAALVGPSPERDQAIAAAVAAKLGGDPPPTFTTLAEALAVDPDGSLFQASSTGLLTARQQELNCKTHNLRDDECAAGRPSILIPGLTRTRNIISTDLLLMCIHTSMYIFSHIHSRSIYLDVT